MQFKLSNNEDFFVQRGEEVINIFDIEGGGGGGGDMTGKTDVDDFTAHTADTSVHFTGDEKAKLSSVASGANVNVQADWSQTGTTADDYVKNKPSIPTEDTVSGWGFTKNAGTITGINMNGASKGTSGVVNLGTVLTAYTETDPIFTASTAYGISASDVTNWNGKADNTAFTEHTSSTTVHVSTSEKNTWSGKQDALSNANVLTGISSTDITNWNTKPNWSETATTSAAYIQNKPTIPNESTVSGWGFTKNAGTITGINMNGASKGTSGVVNLGTVLTEHQSLSGCATSANYDSATKKIYLKHESTVLSEIDATDFIKDGMVSDASVSGSNLVITFNTDAGQEDISIPIADIFNASNYYTKNDIDSKGYLTGYTETDPIFTASTAYGISASDVTNWNGKADNTAFTAHTSSTTVHVSTNEKNTWNGKQDALSNANVLTGISATDVTNWNGKADNTAFTAHTASTTVHVTAGEKSTWNGKQDALANASVLSVITSQNVSNWNSAEQNVQSDWSVTATTSDAFIKNKPTIPSKTSDLTNDSDFVTATEIANLDKIPYITASTAASVTIEPYKMYDFGTLSTAMTVVFDTSKEINGYAQQYMFRVTAGQDCSITLPVGVNYLNNVEPVFTEGHVYEFDITNLMCVFGEFYNSLVGTF